MCLAVPGKVESINGEIATLNYGGIKKDVNVSFIDCKVGDYVLVHVGFAIEVVNKQKAEDLYDLISEDE